MTYSLNSLNVVQGDLSFTRNGAWSADLYVAVDNVATPPAAGDPATVVLDSFTFVGTVLSSNLQASGRLVTRIIGGNGGYPQPAQAKSYAGPSFSVVFNDLMSMSGETGNTGLSNAATMSSALSGWQFLADRSWAENLTRLCAQVGAVWRVDPATGTTYVSVDPFTQQAKMPTGATVDSVSYDTGVSYSVPTLDAFPQPGTLAPDGSPINEVKVVIGSGKLHVVLYNQQLSALLYRRIDGDLQRVYPCTVNSGDASGYSLEPDDPSIRGSGVQNVRVWGGTGTTWNLRPGARVLLAFQGADPSLPCIVGMDGLNTKDFLDTVVFGDSTQAQFLALANLTNQNLQAIVQWVTSLTWAVATTGTATAQTGTATTPKPAPPTLADVSCERVKSD